MTSPTSTSASDDPLADPGRLAAIHRTGLLNLPPDAAFDRLTRLACKSLGAGAAVATLVTDTKAVFLSSLGLSPQVTEAREVAVSEALCHFVVMSGEELVTNDARLESRLRDSPAISVMSSVAYAGVPLRLSEGSVVGAFAVMQDSPRTWTESELESVRDLAAVCVREIESRLPPDQRIRPPGRLVHLLELLPVGLYFTDANARLVYYNRRASDAWGIRPALGSLEETAYAERPLRTSSEEAVELTPVRQALTHRAVPEREYLLGSGPSERRVIYTAALVDTDDGVVTGAVCIMHDVTLFRRATSLRDELLSLVSHEMRTPLTVIGGMAGFLSRETRTRGDDDPFRIAVSDIVGASRRMERVVENMLLLSRLEHESAVLEPILVETACREALARHHRDFPKSNVELILPRERIAFEAVSSWAQLILVNLLGNAEQYGDHRRAHVFQVHHEDDKVLFSVCNSGVPLVEEEYASWFEPFYRAPGTAVEVAGAGLGLTVAKRLAEAQEGYLEARPWDDFDGTKVTLSLRAAELPV